MAKQTQSFAALNAVTQSLRADQRVAQPKAAAPEKAAKLPSIAYVESIPDACAQFVRDMVAAEIARDAAALRACDVADEFVKSAHTAAPDYALYMSTQQTIKAAAALELCFAPMTLIKAYRAALVRAFGALPVSQSPEAIRKAAAREAAKKQADAAAEAGQDATRGVPADKATPEHEVIGQFIARFGAAAVLTELAKILATEKATVKDAHALIEVARHVAAA